MPITGEIIFPPATAAFSGAVLIVELRDTRLADAASRVIERWIFREIHYAPTSDDPVVFTIHCGDLADNPHPTIHVLVDLDKDENVSSGDFINSSSYSYDSDVTFLRIEVQRVE
jgi:hypothetical protein